MVLNIMNFFVRSRDTELIKSVAFADIFDSFSRYIIGDHVFIRKISVDIGKLLRAETDRDSVTAGRKVHPVIPTPNFRFTFCRTVILNIKGLTVFQEHIFDN